jgi:hypothetical protein
MTLKIGTKQTHICLHPNNINPLPSIIDDPPIKPAPSDPLEQIPDAQRIFINKTIFNGHKCQIDQSILILIYIFGLEGHLVHFSASSWGLELDRLQFYHSVIYQQELILTLTEVCLTGVLRKSYVYPFSCLKL